MSAPVLADAGPCDGCGDAQWDHKRGKGGCKQPGCGCGAYETPRAERVRVLTAVAEVTERHATQARSELAALHGEAVDELSTSARVATAEARVAELSALLAEEQRAHRATAERGRAAQEIAERYAGELSRHGRARTAAERDRDQARARVADLTRVVDALRTEVALTVAARDRARAAYDETVRTGLTAAARVFDRYDADLCETCGSRYTVPITHEHPLIPVTVIVARREAAGDA